MLPQGDECSDSAAQFFIALGATATVIGGRVANHQAHNVFAPSLNIII